MAGWVYSPLLAAEAPSAITATTPEVPVTQQPVATPLLTLDRITPAALNISAQRQTIVLEGHGFQEGCRVEIRWNGGGTVIQRRLKVHSDTQIEFQVRTGSSADLWYLQVINPAGMQSNEMELEIRGSGVPPRIIAITPSQLNISRELQTITINGSGFRDDSRVSFNWRTGGTTLTDRVKLINESTIEAQIYTGDKVDQWGVEISNGTGADALRSNQMTFDIIPQLPLTMSAIEPRAVTAGSKPHSITIRGEGMQRDSQLLIQRNGQDLALNHQLLFINTSEMRLEIVPDLEPGWLDLQLENPDGSRTETLRLEIEPDWELIRERQRLANLEAEANYQQGLDQLTQMVAAGEFAPALKRLQEMRVEIIRRADARGGRLALSVYRGIGEDEEAHIWYRHISDWSMLPTDRLELGLSHQRRGEFDEALKLAREIPKGTTGRCGLLQPIAVERMEYHFAQGEYASAIALTQLLEECQVNQQLYLKRLAWSYYLSGEFKKALSAAEGVEIKDSDTCEIIDVLGMDAINSAYDEKRYQDVVAHLPHMKSCNLSVQGAAAIMPWSYFYMQDYQTAAELFERQYRADKSEGALTGLLISKFSQHRVPDLYRIAADVGGGLRERLPKGDYEWRIAHGDDGHFTYTITEDVDLVVDDREFNIDFLELSSVKRRHRGTPGLGELQHDDVPNIRISINPNAIDEIRIEWQRSQLDSGEYSGAGFTSPPTTKLIDGNRMTLGYHHEGRYRWFVELSNSITHGEVEPQAGGRIGGGVLRADYGWNIELGRSPIEESLLSMGGLRSGDVLATPWGAPQLDGASVIGYSTLEGRWRLGGELKLAQISGAGGIDNRMGQIRMELLEQGQQHNGQNIVKGPYLDLERYLKNDSGFTPGSGGYSSPQLGMTIGLLAELVDLYQDNRILAIRGRTGVRWNSYREEPNSLSASSDAGLGGEITMVGMFALGSGGIQLGLSYQHRQWPQQTESIAGVTLRYQMEGKRPLTRRDLYQTLQPLFGHELRWGRR